MITLKKQAQGTIYHTDITAFGHTSKYINHPNLMPNLSTAIKVKTAHA